MSLAGVISMALDSSTSPRVPPLCSVSCSISATAALGLVLPAVHEEPPRALGKVLAHEEDDEPQSRAEQEGDPPRVTDGEVVHHEDGQDGGERAPPQ